MHTQAYIEAFVKIIEHLATFISCDARAILALLTTDVLSNYIVFPLSESTKHLRIKSGITIEPLLF